MCFGTTPGVRPPFEAVARAAHDATRHAIRRLRIPWREQDDVAQKVLLALFRGLPAYDPSRPLDPWLWQVAYRTARDHRALAFHCRERLAGAAALEVADHAPDAERQLIAGQARRRIDALLQRIDARRRAVLVMYYLEGITVAEIAEKQRIPESTARTRLRLARADFKAAWERTPEAPRQTRPRRRSRS